MSDWIQIPLLHHQYKLFLGSAETSVNYHFLEDNQIKYMISLDDLYSEDRLEFSRIYGIRLFPYSLEDNDHPQNERDAIGVSSQVSHQLHQCLKNGNTYIHCQAGVNRAPFCTVKFLIDHEEMNAQHAIDLLIHLNRQYRQLPCLYNSLFVKILGVRNDQVEQFSWMKQSS